MISGSGVMKVPEARELQAILRRIDGRGYRAYKEIQGRFQLPGFELFVDHVQGDPFAAPSKLRARVPLDLAALPAELVSSAVRRLALGDFLAREIRRAIRSAGSGRGRGERGSGKSGLIEIDAGAQEVLERSAVVISPEWVEARLQLGLPAAGRRVLGRDAEELLCRTLPSVVERGLLWSKLPREQAQHFVHCVENQEHIRAQLGELGLIAFVANGSVLPRESGASDRPMRPDDAVSFESPPSLEVEIPVPNPVETPEGPRSSIAGMGVPRGVTLVVGGGYHGKSTLLRALERGVYPHVPGDGREYVVADPCLVKIRAEDGRFVTQVDIQPFINRLPGGRDTRSFCSDDASGSTSQAANIVEAVEAGATGLLLDEDTSATNFMVRDARMQALVHRDHEPITPFLDRVRELQDRLGVSTLLVMGGCGDYFDVADRVIAMREYRAFEVTEEARRVADELGSGRMAELRGPIGGVTERIPLAESFDPSRGRREVKIDAKGRDLILYGSDRIELRGVEQLVDPSQTRGVGLAVHLAAERFMDGEKSLAEVLDRLDAFLDEGGLDPLDPFHRPGRHPGNLARPRRFEIAAAINRLRTLRMRQRANGVA
jgi:predicted ABC-class ATPase